MPPRPKCKRRGHREQDLGRLAEDGVSSPEAPLRALRLEAHGAFCVPQRRIRLHGVQPSPRRRGRSGEGESRGQRCRGDGHLATSPGSPREEGSEEKEVQRCVYLLYKSVWPFIFLVRSCCGWYCILSYLNFKLLSSVTDCCSFFYVVSYLRNASCSMTLKEFS